MDHLIAYTQGIVQNLGPLGVFYASILEEIIVFIPSSLIQMGAGFFLLGGTPFSFAGVLKLMLHVAVPAAIGVFVGSLPIYLIAYYGGEPAIRKWGKWFMLKWEHVANAKEKLSKKRLSFWIITFLRFLPAMPSVVITAFAGVIKLPFWQFLTSTLIGVFFRAFTMGAIGWLTQGLYHKIAEDLNKSEEIIGILILVAVFGTWWWYGNRKKKRADKAI